jgi:hypothetical protein
MTPGDSPEMLFYGIEQCQEIQQIGKVPYSDDQIIATAVCILVMSNMFPLKKFDAWEAMANNTYPALKVFFHEMHRQCLTALELHSMSGQNGYISQTKYNILKGNDDTNNDTVTSLTQTAAAAGAGTTATFADMSGITTCTNDATMNADFAAAINQLAANQTTIMTQMAALSFTQEPAQHTRRFVAREPFQVPPIQQLAFPTQQAPFQAGAFHAGRGGRQGGRNWGCGHGGRGHTLFADDMHTAGAAPATPTHIAPYGRGNAQPPLGQRGVQQV